LSRLDPGHNVRENLSLPGRAFSRRGKWGTWLDGCPHRRAVSVQQADLPIYIPLSWNIDFLLQCGCSGMGAWLKETPVVGDAEQLSRKGGLVPSELPSLVCDRRMSRPAGLGCNGLVQHIGSFGMRTMWSLHDVLTNARFWRYAFSSPR
jgi:hypothetical protein